MRHRIARRFIEPLLHFLRRSSRRCACRCLVGPTVHHTGARPPQAASPLAVPGIGIGIGSCGIPSVVVRGIK